MLKSFAQRHSGLERLDTGDYTEAEYQLWQREMVHVHRLFGESRALRLSLQSVPDSINGSEVSILDVGAGSGELLKTSAKILGQRKMTLVGAEMNHAAARTIAEIPCLHSVRCDGLNLPFADDSFDFVISSLFLHHLANDPAVTLIKEMSRVARHRFFIIDLHRHPVAYYFYRAFGPIFLQRFTVEDGSLSILRSFRPAELIELALQAGVSAPRVDRRAAFRLVLSGSK